MDIRQQIKERAQRRFTERPVHKVDVPEWQATVFFKTPNMATLSVVNAEARDDRVEWQARLVVACVTDEAGNKLWSKIEYKDLMSSYDPDVVMRIANAIAATINLDFGAKELAEDEKN